MAKLTQTHTHIQIQLHCIGGKQLVNNAKPRLVRQQAVQEEITADLSYSPPRLGVRFLPTIPSAADSSVIMDEESINDANNANDRTATVGTPFYTVLQGDNGNTLTTLSSPKNNNLKKPP